MIKSEAAKKTFFYEKIRLIFVLTLAIVLMSAVMGCATSKEIIYPAWYTEDGLEEEFPSASYVREIGTGKTKQDAENDAISYISRRFETEVSSSYTSNMSANSTDGSTSVIESINVTNTTFSNMKLFGIEYNEGFYNKKEDKYYVVAYIDINNAWKQHEPSLRMERDKFMAYYEAAEKEKEAVYRIKLLNNALASSVGFTEKLEKLHPYEKVLFKRITDKNFGSDIKTISAIPSMIENELLTNPVFIAVDDDCNGIIEDAVREIFTQKGFSVIANKANAAYVANVNVSYNPNPDNSRVALNPSMTLSLDGKAGSIYTIGVECSRVVAPTEQAAKKTAAKDLSAEIKEKLPDGIKNSLDI
ncbi:MAG: LPP20 family lipoprotein [Treponemataceae bacterium]|nr:LPP20 family lipoprotein [Treponemataceae bacterium]